ncbi:MAG: hypothetical protein MN733_28870 [Nitrososphaera sp.]|nr:hypothetical protein [Nitrososphaera sp.]
MPVDRIYRIACSAKETMLVEGMAFDDVYAHVWVLVNYLVNEGIDSAV